MSVYKEAGVDIDRADQILAALKNKATSTHGPEVLQGIGAFAGLFDASALKTMQSPVLVASTDGIGTKSEIAVKMGRYNTIGYDIVNHCINDILTQGVTPLFFLDYLAMRKLDRTIAEEIIAGCANACERANCALLGGELAEMPDVYMSGAFDLVGTIIGAVSRRGIIDGSAIKVGDIIIGLASTGLHTNGYSLVRHILRDEDYQELVPELGQTWGDALLVPHRSYLPEVRILRKHQIAINGIVHITGGGLTDNPPRIMPAGLVARIDYGSWPVPPIFDLLQKIGWIEDEEMRRVFNLGLGILLVIPVNQMKQALELLGQSCWIVGEIKEV